MDPRVKPAGDGKQFYLVETSFRKPTTPLASLEAQPAERSCGRDSIGRAFSVVLRTNVEHNSELGKKLLIVPVSEPVRTPGNSKLDMVWEGRRREASPIPINDPKQASPMSGSRFLAPLIAEKRRRIAGDGRAMAEPGSIE